MIEAAQYATPYQRQLHDRYAEIHRKFFTPPPPPPPPIVEASPPPPPPAEPVAEPPRRHVGIEQTVLRLKIIRRIVCQSHGLSREAFLTKKRANEFVRPRQVYSYLANRLTRASLPTIARTLKQTHWTVMASIDRIQLRIGASFDYAEQVRMLENRIKDEFGENNRSRMEIARYVPHHQVLDYFMLGWMHVANFKDHGALMIWRCGCNCVEPKE